MIDFLVYIFLILFFRVILLKKAQSKAVDQWYWLKYRDAVRAQKTCPPNLPEYLLEIKQWYPPFFGYFLAILPNNIFKYSIFLIQLISFFRLTLIIGFAYFLNMQFSIPLFFAIIFYISAPILVYYDNQINSRIFGAIILDILILLFWGYFEYHQFYLLIPIISFTTLLLFTHKMSHQLYFFLLVILSFFYLSIIPLLSYLFANIIAFLFFNYKNYFKAHIDIVKFWHRNRYKLGAHQFYESKLYGKDNFTYKNRLHGNGIKSIVKKFSLIIGMLPFTIFVMYNFQFNYFGIIILAMILFVLLTSFIDIFLCLGSGNLYTYNLVTILSYFMIYTNIDVNGFDNKILLFLVFMLTIISIFKFYKGINQVYDKDLEEAINMLNSSNVDRILAIPLTPSDQIVYRTGKKVFWGGHGYGFKILEPYYPVFNERLEITIKNWNLGAILLQKEYWIEFFDKVDNELFDILLENEKYIILSVKGFENKDLKPFWVKKMYKEMNE